MKITYVFVVPLLLLGFYGYSQVSSVKKTSTSTKTDIGAKKSDSEWKKILSPETYNIMVNKGTEPPFKNPYWDNHQKGIYVSAATGKPLFSSDAKFESGTGWPSFFKAIDPNAVEIITDKSFGMVREEVVERSTGLHLGHLFNDGPQPTGLRFCMNSYALKFIPSK